MLSDADLQAIGTIVDTKLDQRLEPVLEAVREGFEAVDRRFVEMASKVDLATMRHELMDHTDRTVHKAVGDLRAELRERDML
jgi:hypothetical protein